MAVGQIISRAIAQGAVTADDIGALEITHAKLHTDMDLSSKTVTMPAVIRGPATLTIDPAAVGDNTGTLVIAGDLQVDGTTTTINSTTMTVDDKNIVLASGAGNSAAADGAGLTIDGASATMLYTHATTSFDFNKNIKSPGATFSGDVSLPDNVKTIYGTGSDSEILFDGSDTVIKHGAGSGKLELQTRRFDVKNTANDETLIKAIAGAAVTLYHNNVEKLKTQFDGIDITGDLTLTSTDAGAVVDPTLTLYRNSASPNSWDYLGEILFKGRNDASQDVEYSRINGMIEDKTDGTENGRIQFWNMRNGTLQESIYLDSWGNLLFQGDNARIIWNDLNGTTYDAYLGWNNLTAQRNINFPDADGTLVIADSSGNVGIGTTSPGQLLEVTGSGATIRVESTDNNQQGIEFYQNNTKNASIMWGQGNANLEIKNFRNDQHASNLYANIDFFTGGSNATSSGSPAYTPDLVMRLTDDGNVGIGTTAPVSSGYDTGSTKLTVMSTTLNNATSGYLELASRANSNGYNAGAIQFNNFENAGTAGSGVQNRTVGQIRTVIVTTDSNAGDDSGGTMEFYTKSEAGNLTQNMTIHSNGNVGINTNNPLAQLEIDPSAVDTPIFAIRRQDHASIPLFKFFQDSSVAQGTGHAHMNTGNRDLSITADGNSTKADGIYLSTLGNVGLGVGGTPLGKLVVVAGGTGILVARHWSGTATSGQALGEIGFKGYADGNTTSGSDAKITGVADANHSGTSAPARLEFYVKHPTVGPGSAPTRRMQLSAYGELLLEDDAKGWASFYMNEQAGIRYHVRRYYAGSSTVTSNMLRVKRHYWGVGFYKLTAKQQYYSTVSEQEFYLIGHGRDDGSYNPSYALSYQNVYNGTSSRMQITSPSGSAPGNSAANYVDVQIVVPAYHHYIVVIEAGGMASYSQDVSSMSGNDMYALHS